MNETRYRDAEQALWRSVGVAPTEQRVHLARNNVTVRILEAGEGPPLLLVHGASNCGTSWADLVARLPTRRCLMLDRPGCGLSDPLPHGMGLDSGRRMAETLVADIADALDLATVDLGATSLGGYIALRTAVAAPQRVRRIVLFGWPAGAPVAHVPAVMRWASAPGLRSLAGAVPPSRRAVRAMLRRVGLRSAIDSGRFTAEALDSYTALLRDTDTMRNEITNGRFMTFRGLDPSVALTPEELRSIRTPMYFLWGEDDPLGGPDIAASVVDLIPGAELEVMPGAGHAVWIDDPDHAAKVTDEFLAQ
jgi:2-hydroxy-6-oxonona-2,4-dienedioate hydrolase